MLLYYTLGVFRRLMPHGSRLRYALWRLEWRAWLRVVAGWDDQRSREWWGLE